MSDRGVILHNAAVSYQHMVFVVCSDSILHDDCDHDADSPLTPPLIHQQLMELLMEVRMSWQVRPFRLGGLVFWLSERSMGKARVQEAAFALADGEEEISTVEVESESDALASTREEG